MHNMIPARSPQTATIDLRNYKTSSRQEIVEHHYKLMRVNQTLDFVLKMEDKYFKFDKAQMTIREAFEKLGNYIDSSDPDVLFPNIEHMYQTAEGIRKAGLPDWLQLVGLIHDMGKIMYLWGNREDGQQGTADGNQWALGGDTWIVGCEIPNTIVFPEFNKDNPEYGKYDKYGIYSPNCGLEKVKFAFGHDEYMYRMLKYNSERNICTIPHDGLLTIRYHSCYVWHTENEYEHLMNENDYKIKDLVNILNRYDLYTKVEQRVNINEACDYYSKLIDKYLPAELYW